MNFLSPINLFLPLTSGVGKASSQRPAEHLIRSSLTFASFGSLAEKEKLFPFAYMRNVMKLNWGTRLF